MGTGTGADVCGSKREVFLSKKNTADRSTVEKTMAVSNGQNNA
jgi:hypothetical protein